MPVLPANKYHLKDLYKEIDLFDRKIAYCNELEKFETEEMRSEAERKLQSRRKLLVKAAEKMTEQGIQCDAKDLPRSMKNAPMGSVQEQA